MEVTEKTVHTLYLTFRLEDEIFALEVEHLREVLDMCPITKIPRAESYMRGVINVRGSVVPVMDLRTKLGLPSVEPTINTRIIILEIPFEGKKTIMGAIADSVEDVLEIDSDHINEAPDLGSQKHQSIMKGIGKNNNNFMIILDLDKLLRKHTSNVQPPVVDSYNQSLVGENISYA